MKQYFHIFFTLVISDNPGACHRAIKNFLKWFNNFQKKCWMALMDDNGGLQVVIVQ